MIGIITDANWVRHSRTYIPITVKEIIPIPPTIFYICKRSVVQVDRIFRREYSKLLFCNLCRHALTDLHIV